MSRFFRNGKVKVLVGVLSGLMVINLSGCSSSDPTKGTTQDLDQLKMSPAERTKMVEQMRAKSKLAPPVQTQQPQVR